MKSDYDLIVHRFEKPINIYPIADVHFGSLNHQESAWATFIDNLLQEEDSYVILDGDLINNNTRSSVGSPFDDLVRPRDQKIAMAKFLEPIRDKILCITSGNHENRSLKDADDDPTYDIACKLDIEDIYRPNAAFMKIGIGSHSKNAEDSRCKQIYTFAVTHGSGGGIYTGTAVTKNERWTGAIDNLDCMIAAHIHKGAVTRPDKLVIDTYNNKVTLRHILVVSCVSWQAYGDYSLRKMMLPAEIANPQKLHLHDEKKYISATW